MLTKEEFRNAMNSFSGGMEPNVERMPEWFERTLATLAALGKQEQGVDHPGRGGTSRETPLQELLVQMLPKSLSVVKGFALNRLMVSSREQDLLIVDGNTAGGMSPRENCFPIESCLASIQVESELTRSTIREATVNCASVKRLFGWPLVDQGKSDEANDRLCYGVFSYGSDRQLDRLARVVNEEMQGVNRQSWPNAFYVLGKGMLIPGEGTRVPLDKDTMFRGSTFVPVQDVGALGMESSEARSFLWFLSNIMDHCIEQRGKRESPSYQAYWSWMLHLHVAIDRARHGNHG